MSDNAVPQELEGWVLTQKKTFTKWCNNHLKKKGYGAIDDAATSFESGITLMQLINALYDLPIPKHNANPKMRPHKLDNIELALKMVEDAQIKTNFLKHNHLVDHDLKMILGMMWSIILDYAIKGISEDDTTAKEGLLLWVRKKTAGYRDVDPPGVTNFTRDFKNGLVFNALIHRHQPHLIDYDSLDKADAEKNLEQAFTVAEGLGIPRLLDVEDLLTEKPDERSVMTQVAEYYRVFAAQGAKEVAARRAQKFIEFTRSINAAKSAYEGRVKELLEWVQSVIERFQNENFGTTLEESVAVTERLKEFILSEKPAKSALKLELENEYADIQTQLRVRDRPAYDVPAEFSPETLDAAFDSLWESEKAHAAKAREVRFSYITKKEQKLSEEQLEEMTSSYKHFDKDSDEQLDKVEFKAALSAMGIPLKDDAALNDLLAKVSEGTGKITLAQWIKFNTELALDQDTPDQIKESFKMLADDREAITADSLRVPPLTQEDVDYLTAAMPEHANGGFDYVAFVDSSFAAKAE